MLCWPCSVGRTPIGALYPIRGIMEGRPANRGGISRSRADYRGMPETVRVSRHPLPAVFGRAWKPDLLMEEFLRPGGDQPGVGWLERSGKMRPSVTEEGLSLPHFCSSKMGEVQEGVFLAGTRPKRKPTFTLPRGSLGYARDGAGKPACFAGRVRSGAPLRGTLPHSGHNGRPTC